MDGALLPADLQHAMGMSSEELRHTDILIKSSQTTTPQQRCDKNLTESKSEIIARGSCVTTTVLESLRASLANANDRVSQNIVANAKPPRSSFQQSWREEDPLSACNPGDRVKGCRESANETTTLQTPPHQQESQHNGERLLSNPTSSVMAAIHSSPLTSASAILECDNDGSSSLSSVSASRRVALSRNTPYSNERQSKIYEPASHVSITSESTAPSPDANIEALIRLFSPRAVEKSSNRQTPGRPDGRQEGCPGNHQNPHLSIPLCNTKSSHNSTDAVEDIKTDVLKLSWPYQASSCANLPIEGLNNKDDNHTSLALDRAGQVELESYNDYTPHKRQLQPSRTRLGGFQSPSSGTFLNKGAYGNFDAQETLKRLLDCLNNIPATNDTASASAALALRNQNRQQQQQDSSLDGTGGGASRRLFMSPYSTTSSQESLSPCQILNSSNRGSCTAPAAMMNNNADSLLRNLLDSLNCEDRGPDAINRGNMSKLVDVTHENVASGKTITKGRKGPSLNWAAAGDVLHGDVKSRIPQTKVGEHTSQMIWPTSSSSHEDIYDASRPRYQSDHYPAYPPTHHHQHTFSNSDAQPRYLNNDNNNINNSNILNLKRDQLGRVITEPQSSSKLQEYMESRDDSWSLASRQDIEFRLREMKSIASSSLSVSSLYGGGIGVGSLGGSFTSVMNEQHPASHSNIIMNRSSLVTNDLEYDVDSSHHQGHLRKVYTDDRDRMVYVSWIPKKARAYNTLDKRRMELDLKRRLREDLGLAGLTKVLLFPPKGVHCKLIFDCRSSAFTFMETYGGDNRSAKTEKWKADLCRIYEIDMHDRFEKTVVKIEWSQK